jgi:hypothetical protein
MYSSFKTNPTCSCSCNKTTRNLVLLLAIAMVLIPTSNTKTSHHHVAAFPFGAGHCDAGKAIANGAHGLNGSGSLANGNYELRIVEESTATTSSSCPSKKLKPKRSASLRTGTKYTVTLSATDADDGGYFRGFLIRLSGKNQDGEDAVAVSKEALIVSPDFDGVGKDHTLCSSTVVGVTHVNASDKTSVDVILSFEQPIEALLEVTVVRNNRPMGSDLWYYDSFDIVVSDSSSSSKSSKSSKSCKGIKMTKVSKKSGKSSKSSRMI